MFFVCKTRVMVREAGLEPATSRLSAGCSNRLSYPRKGKSPTNPIVIIVTDFAKPNYCPKSFHCQFINCNVRRQLKHFIEVSG